MNNDVYRALADPTRRQILHLLRDGSRTAGDVAAQFAQAASTISGHLSVLTNAGLIVQERQGQRLVYHLQMSVVEEAVAALLALTGRTTQQSEES